MSTIVKEKTDLKYSNVDWFGKVPIDWRVEKIKSHFNLSKERASSDDNDILSLTQKGIKVRDISGNEGQMAASYDNYAKLRKGDIVLNPMDLISGYVDLAKQEGIISPAYTILRKKKTDLNLEYAKHFFQWHYKFNIFFPFGRGVSVDHRWTLGDDVLMNFPILIPPVKTQAEIAGFLDEKTKKIDKIIEKKQRLIKLLGEKRISTIASSINSACFDNQKKLKFCFKLLSEKNNSSDGHKRIYLENIVGWTGEFIETNSENGGQGILFKKDDILFGKLRPYLAKSMLAEFEGEAIGDILVYRPSKEINSEFAFYNFISHKFIDTVNSSTYGVKMPRANPFFIGELLFSYPNLIVQKQIASSLTREAKKIDQGIDRIISQIKKLKEYRASLIYNAVTGKIKI